MTTSELPPIIVVTGGNRGIGREICRQLAARGAEVILSARGEKSGRSAAEKLTPKASGGRVHFYPLDVTSDVSANALAAFVGLTFGRCDVLINNAGIVGKEDNAILSVEPATVQLTLDTNAVGPLRVTQALLPWLRKSPRKARVINISSSAGELANFDGSWAPAYSLSKAALNLVTRMLTPALGRYDITVNAMCPGWVRTDMGGANAERDVAQGADTAVWLALDAPKELTGKFLRDRKEIPW